MYEERFGFKLNPFRAVAEGSAVFVGPRQAKVMSRLQKALSGSDNIVTVSGPVGVGKTSIVTRALETNSKHQMVAWISRMRLAPDEVLELLLAGFGVSRKPVGTVQQFATFKHVLNERAKSDIRVVIVIEDALRIGNDALLELEALTSSEADGTGGANIVLMGPPEIDKRINFPELARLRQRARMAQKIQPFNAAEVHGYLTHCMRIAGSSFDQWIDNDAAAMVYRCSEGIPRVIDNICESVFTAAAETNKSKITRDLVRTVAADMLGLEPVLPEPEPMPVASTPIVEPIANLQAQASAKPDPPPVVEAKVAPRPVLDSEPVLQPETALQAKPARPLDPVVDAPRAAKMPERPASASLPTSKEPIAPARPTPVEAEEPISSGTDLKASLPPVVAAALAQEEEEAGPDPLQIDELSETDQASETDSIDDIADDQLIADTGTYIPPQFSPDPELDIPASQLATPPPEPQSDAEIDEAFDELPTLSTSMRVDVPIKTSAEEPPAVDAAGLGMPEPPVSSESNPKSQDSGEVEELRPIPDLDALEAAILAARSNETYAEPEAPEIAATGANIDELADSTSADSDDQPMITLDQSLTDQRQDVAKLDQLAEELANGNSLEDMSDAMAETLFGIEFEQIAAAAIANPLAKGTVPGEIDVVAEPVVAATTADKLSANDPISESSPVMLEIGAATSTEPAGTGKMVGMPAERDDDSGQQPGPDSIENQFETSATQTVKAPGPLPVPIDDNDDEAKSVGLFGRIKKTFKG